MRDRWRVTFRIRIVLPMLIVLLALTAAPGTSAQTAASTSSPAAPQMMFATPQAAADALIQGAKT